MIVHPTTESLRSYVRAMQSASATTARSVELVSAESELDCDGVEPQLYGDARDAGVTVLREAGFAHIRVTGFDEWPVGTALNKAEFHYGCLRDRPTPPPARGTVLNRRLDPIVVVDRVILVHAMATSPDRLTAGEERRPADDAIVTALIAPRAAPAGSSVRTGSVRVPPAAGAVAVELTSSDPDAMISRMLAPDDGRSVTDSGDGSGNVFVPLSAYPRLLSDLAGIRVRNSAQTFVTRACTAAHARALLNALASEPVARIAAIAEEPFRELLLCGDVHRARPSSTLA
ncbi:MAG TPA: hypothetical protein VGC96_05185 [Candidatus Elarobacter sp.]